jgi:hypothetical protein
MLKVFFVAFIFSLIIFPVLANESVDSVVHVETDQGSISLRKFDNEKVINYRSDSDFQYKATKEEGITWWDRIKFAIMQFIAQLLSLATNTLLGRIIFYTLCISLLLYFLIKFLNIDVKETFYRSSKSSTPGTAHDEENIYEISFEERIKEAYDRKDFRECARLTFLYALKKLSDRQVITWRPGKTNEEYWQELNQHPARQSWQELRLYFDYAWYGHFDIDEKTYGDIQNVFGEFNRKLS